MVWGVVIKGECLSAAVVTGISVGVDEGSGRSIIRDMVGVVDVEVGVVTDRVADGSKSVNKGRFHFTLKSLSITIACDPNILGMVALGQTPS